MIITYVNKLPRSVAAFLIALDGHLEGVWPSYLSSPLCWHSYIQNVDLEAHTL